MTKKAQGFLWAYTDESGNTGLNIFDESQPVYWTGTLVSTVDLQQVGSSAIPKWCALVGTSELHGNELGFGRLETVAASIRHFLSTHKCRLLFTQVEKRHVASTKLVDTLLDSGLNRAVSNIHYGMRPFRLMLAVDIIRNLTRRDEEEFWNAYKKLDTAGFCKILERLQLKIFERMTDPRGKELLLDAIGFALKNPAELLTSTLNKLDSPNIVALTLLMDALRRLHKETGLQIGRFCHDEQNQFAKSMREVFDVCKNVGSTESPPAWMCDIQRVQAFDCHFEIVRSSGAVGLQLIDVALWLTKKASESPLANTLPECRALLREIFLRASISNFTRTQLIEDAHEEYAKVLNVQLSEKKLAKGKKLMADFENKRLDRMHTNHE